MFLRHFFLLFILNCNIGIEETYFSIKDLYGYGSYADTTIQESVDFTFLPKNLYYFQFI